MHRRHDHSSEHGIWRAWRRRSDDLRRHREVPWPRPTRRAGSHRLAVGAGRWRVRRAGRVATIRRRRIVSFSAVGRRSQRSPARSCNATIATIGWCFPWGWRRGRRSQRGTRSSKEIGRCSTRCGRAQNYGAMHPDACALPDWLTRPAVGQVFFFLTTTPVTPLRRADQAELCQCRYSSSRPTSETILPSSSLRTVVPVNRILRPVAAGSDPIRKSLKAGPECVPPPSQRPTT